MRNDRWSEINEIKEKLEPCNGDSNIGGPILYCEKETSYSYGGEGHTIILGVSGSGKSRRCTIPMIRNFIESKESFIVLDPKGEIYHKTSCFAKNSFNIKIINFKEIEKSDGWNPLLAPYKLYKSDKIDDKQKAIEMVDELSHALYPEDAKDSPFWADSARSLFIAAVYSLFECAKSDEINISSVYSFVVKGEERGLRGMNFLKNFILDIPDDSINSMLLNSYITTATETKGGIRSTFLEGISIFNRSEGLKRFLSQDDLNINELDIEKPIGIYIILPDESPIYDTLAGVLISQLLNHFIRLADKKYNGKLPNRLNFCIEELGSVGKAISNLPHLMSAGRSRNLRAQLVLQSLSQLVDIYGTSKATTITSNADLTIAFRINHWETLSELSKKCGEKRVVSDNFNSREALVTPTQLASFETGQALVIISGSIKFVTKLPDYEKIFDMTEWEPPEIKNKSDYVKTRVFNIKEYVETTFNEKRNIQKPEDFDINML